MKTIQPAALKKLRDLIENRKIQRRTDMQTAYISIWMKDEIERNQNFYYRNQDQTKQSKVKGLKCIHNKRGGTEVKSGAEEREKCT